MFCLALSLSIAPVIAYLSTTVTISNSGVVSLSPQDPLDLEGSPLGLVSASFEGADFSEVERVEISPLTMHSPGTTSVSTWTTGLLETRSEAKFAGDYGVYAEGIEDGTWWDRSDPSFNRAESGGARARLVWEKALRDYSGNKLYLDEVYVRLYIKLIQSDTYVEFLRLYSVNTGDPSGKGSYVTRMWAEATSGSNNLKVEVGCYKAGGALIPWSPDPVPGQIFATGFTWELNRWYSIEERFVKGVNGGVQVWVDDTLVIDRMNIDTSSLPGAVGSVQVGVITMGQHPGSPDWENLRDANGNELLYWPENPTYAPFYPNRGVRFHFDDVVVSTSRVGTSVFPMFRFFSADFEDETVGRNVTNYNEHIGGMTTDWTNGSSYQVVQMNGWRGNSTKAIKHYVTAQTAPDGSMAQAQMYIKRPAGAPDETFDRAYIGWWVMFEDLPTVDTFDGIGLNYFLGQTYNMHQQMRLSVQRRSGSLGVYIDGKGGLWGDTSSFYPYDLSVNTWYHFEMWEIIDAVNGAHGLKINGETMFHHENLNTSPPDPLTQTPPGGFDVGIFNYDSSNDWTLWVDDVVFWVGGVNPGYSWMIGR